MQSRTQNPRRELERSLTWPPALDVATRDFPAVHNGENGSISAAPHGTSTHGLFEDDLQNNPESHFLSPVQMYEYEDWAEDSDSDAEEVEWDAGITDFALFDDDRRRAQKGNKPLPSKWSGMLEKQTSALQRAVQRNRADSKPDPVNRPLPISEDDVPNLTPDVSPELRDDLDVESFHGQRVARLSVPNYLTITVTPPEDDNGDYEALEEDDEPLSFYVAKRQLRAKAHRKLERPGLRHSRTMSGQVHAWRRPSMYTVGEESEAEQQAERNCRSDGEDHKRGRR